MLNAKRIEEQIKSSLWRISTFDMVGSTNVLVKDYLRTNGSEGFVAVALEQGGGYGRQGRSWKSPLGGLYFSFSLDTYSSKQTRCSVNEGKSLASVSLVVALALKATFEKLGVACAQIKWPNDVLINEKKTCGISLEGVMGGICVGVGINVFMPQGAQTNLSSSYETTYLSSALLEYKDCQKVAEVLSATQEELLEVLVIEFFNAFSPLYEQWKQDGFSALRVRYNDALFNVGQEVTLETITHNVLIEGMVQGVDIEGRLLLTQRDGSVIAASSGEVHTKH